MRAKLPRGKGFWPAFWLLPISNAWPPEIDIMENLGHDTTTVYFNHHWGTAEKHKMEEGKYSGPDFSKGFHTFGLLWDKTTLAWYVDGRKVFQTRKNIQQEPMYVIANLAVGGAWPGNPDETTIFPAFLDVDYIRVWQKAKIVPKMITPGKAAH
jgi:beta-glucanase (GH16 family)